MPVFSGERLVGTLYLTFVQVSTESPPKRQVFASRGKSLPLTPPARFRFAGAAENKSNNTNWFYLICRILCFGTVFASLGQGQDEK
jgi:hypothetical protein